MRTTVTLEEDVIAKLKAEMRRSGKSFKETLNEALRRGLLPRKQSRPQVPFQVRARDLGELRPGLSLDDVGGLLDRVEGEQHR